jgi:hypothetical protein
MPEPSASSLNGKSSSGRMRTGQSDEFLEFHKGVFLGQAPDKPNILHGQVKECTCMVREPRDELLVKVDVADEGLHLLLFEGVSQSATPAIFTRSISTLLCEILRYSILVFSNSHFSGQR